MKYPIIIVIVLVINFVYSKNFNLWRKIDDYKRDLNFLIGSVEQDDPYKEPEVCDTSQCDVLGREFRQGMNTSVNPCDDFYNYVCGGWGNYNEIPGYLPTWSRPLMFQHTVYRRIKGILETKPTKNDILPVRQAKKWYRACMDLDALEKRGIIPLESILMQLGGWPMTIDNEEWDENGHSWQIIEQHYFHLTGSYIFYDVDIYDSEEDGIRLEKGKLPLFTKLPFTYRNYTGDEYDGYMKLIEDTVQMFVDHNKANVTVEMIKKDVEDLVNFEKKLYEIFEEDDDSNVEDYKTIGEFIEEYERDVDLMDINTSRINFRKLIANKFDMIGLGLNCSMTIDTYGYNYFLNLTKLLNRTPKRIIENYLHWYFVSDMLVYTTEKMRDIFFQFMENELGLTEREPRWLQCIKEVKMQAAKSYVFVKNYFSKEAERVGREMVENIREGMKSQIQSSDWLNKETKDMIIDKLENIQIYLGFPDWFKNKTLIVNSYKGLTIDYDHFDNVLSYKKYEIKKKWRNAMFDSPDLGRQIDPIGIGAMYKFQSNMIEIPAADFQPPLFTPQLPSAINYGSVGSIIGHEIGHAYDDYGITFGKNGNRSEISEKIMEIYNKRTNCFLNQFNNYFGVTEPDYENTTPGRYEGSRGRITRGENMADTMGLLTVIDAYKKWRVKNIYSITKLPGFEKFTDDQLFFISFGALWCEMATPRFRELEAIYDVHSPQWLRVRGAVSNSEQFAKAFKCPKGSPMNPDNKCDVWKSESHTKVRKIKKNRYHHPWRMDW